jgi:excisionase family DNA binding protein
MCVPTGDLPLALTVEQAAKLLNISRNLAYDLVRQGVIPSLRLGRIIRISRSRLEEWMVENDGQRQPPDEAVGF